MAAKISNAQNNGYLMPSLTSCMQGRWADWLILILILIGIAALWQWVDEMVSSGPPTAYVYHDDVLLARYPLEQGKTIRMQAEGSIGISDIVIDGNGASFTSSPCTTQQCVLSGTHHRSGDIAACVPNRILISIRGTQKATLDAISQ